MTTTESSSASSGRFALHHPWDRNFYLALVICIWIPILRGFGGELVDHVVKHEPAFALIVHLHALVFVSWLILLTVQILLIRVQKAALHMRLGMAMVWLAGLMVIIGPMTALTVQHSRMGTPRFEPAFLSIQLLDIVAFAGLTFAGIFWRKRLAAHKRLIFLGTIAITGAGFARWLGDAVVARFGFSFWTFWLFLDCGPLCLMLLIGVYDLVTRRRLHPAYLAGLAWAVCLQMIVLTLFFAPAWKSLATRIIAAWPL